MNCDPAHHHNPANTTANTVSMSDPYTVTPIVVTVVTPPLHAHSHCYTIHQRCVNHAMQILVESANKNTNGGANHMEGVQVVREHVGNCRRPEQCHKALCRWRTSKWCIRR